MKLGLAIKEVAEAEEQLAQALLEVGERHAADQDVHHLTRLLSRWAQGHIAALAPLAERHGEKLNHDKVGRESSGPLASVRETGATLLGRRPASGLLLLRDVRKLHLLAAEASIDWTILGQAAQAGRDTEVLECVTLSHPETLRTLRWTTTKLKETAPQVLTT